MGAQREEPDDGCIAATGDMIRFLVIGALVVVLIVFVVFVAMAISRGDASTDPKYTVAVTGAAGLDDLYRPTTALSPVFNLTIHIDNTGDTFEKACLGRFSTAAVSYGDAFLARGSVPAFCAGTEQEGERDATAWGQDVVVPRFLRERLAGELERGEAEVDVQVRTPDGRHDVVLACKVKIGGGSSSPCSRDHVYARPAPISAGLPVQHYRALRASSTSSSRTYRFRRIG